MSRTLDFSDSKSTVRQCLNEITLSVFLSPSSGLKYEKSKEKLCLVAEELVRQKMEEIQQKVHLDQSVEGAYLTHLLLSDQMTVTEILGSMTELLLAGVDTVSTDSVCALLLA